MKEKKEKAEVIELSKKRKSITLKNSDLEMLTNSEGLKSLRESKDLPIEFSFKLAMLLDELQSPMKAYMKEKQKLIDKYADRDKEDKLVEHVPGQFVFTTKAQWFQKDFNELLNLESTFDCEKLKILMKDVPQGAISANDIISLVSIITFSEK